MRIQAVIDDDLYQQMLNSAKESGLSISAITHMVRI
jgi:hypothetical protein